LNEHCVCGKIGQINGERHLRPAVIVNDLKNIFIFLKIKNKTVRTVSAELAMDSADRAIVL
jgi:hypothetical protein